jgi:Zn finger protein HypA/HybF involved in hydrogenase expression
MTQTVTFQGKANTLPDFFTHYIKKLNMDEIILKLVEEGLSTYKIAEKLGIGQSTVSKHLRKLGISTKAKSGPRLNLDNPNLLCKKCNQLKEKRNNRYCNKCSPGHRKVLEIDKDTGPKTVRKILLEKRGATCERCHLDLWMGIPISLQVHHIDGNADNNTENNLQLLCPNCHSQTPNFMGKNIGTVSKRSKYRRSYYYS